MKGWIKMNEYIEELMKDYNEELEMCNTCPYDACIYDDCSSYNIRRDLDNIIANELDKTSI